MNKKEERQALVRFSAAKLERLPMAEKLAYLRAAFKALGNGLQVKERRGSTPPRSAPAWSPVSRRMAKNSPLFRMLSREEFDRLAMEDKVAYTRRAIRELKETVRDLRGRMQSARRSAREVLKS